MEQAGQQAAQASLEAFDEQTSKLTRNYLAMQDQLATVAGELMRARKARVDELLEKERLGDRLAQLLQVLPGAVIVIDNDGIVVECNSYTIELFGRPVVGQTWSEIVARVADVDAGSNGDLRLRDGRCLSLARCTLSHEQGEILLLMDISETQRLQAIVQRQNRLSSLGEMSARIAHQIRTPLSAAILYLTRLAEPGTVTPEQREKYLSRSVQRLRDLETLVDDTLIFAGGVNETQEQIDLAAIVQGSLDILRPQLRNGVQIRMESCDQPIPLSGNRAAIESAILNLLMNAMQFSPDDGTIFVAIELELDQARIRVRDQGPGIPLEYHDRIFEPFFSTRSQGTGLGLAVVNTVALAHGGAVIVNDQTDGTEFVLSLPRSFAARPGMLRADLAAATENSLHV